MHDTKVMQKQYSSVMQNNNMSVGKLENLLKFFRNLSNFAKQIVYILKAPMCQLTEKVTEIQSS